MADELLTRVQRIASEVLAGKTVQVTAGGEGYYSFALPGTEPGGSTFPPVWIAPAASDQEIRVKLTREFQDALHPEGAADDASVPNLQNEGVQQHRIP